MRSVLRYIEAKQSAFSTLPFFDHLRDATLTPQERLSFAPAMAPFVMAFADLNNFSLRVERPSHLFEHIINKHSEEDATHFELYMEDVQTLGFHHAMRLDQTLSYLWSPSRKHSRNTCYALTGLLSSASITMRLVIVEAIEATGAAAFEVFSQLAHEYRAVTGQELRYFGSHHKDLETGHTMGTDDIEERLLAIELTDEERAQAEQLVDRVFDLFTLMVEEFHAACTPVVLGKTG